jgi:nucleotide-binding universal stress UspA family protein
MYTNIVVGTDGSDTALAALRHAIDLASVNGATVHVVSAYRSSGAAVKVGTEAEHWYVDTRTKIDSVLDSAAALVRSKGLAVEVHAVESEPGDAIVATAEATGADAVVVGNKGMRGAKRFLLGSVPNKVAHNAPCTVVIVKTT